jgi:hypothetical protein
MQKSGQNSIAEKGFAATAGEVRSEPLAISSCTLAVIRSMSCLLDSGPQTLEREESWVGETFVGQVKFHPRSKRFGVRFVSYINVWYKTENTLLLFRLELLGSNLLRGIGHSNRPVRSHNAEFDVG